ncbi:hypothetical protein HDU93_002294, partial [Gonapodya sp. JEL0774]
MSAKVDSRPSTPSNRGPSRLKGKFTYETHASAVVPPKPVSLAGPADTLRDLPTEVAAMDAEATACRYCGVSYLLLHEVERMKKYVKAMEDKLAGLEQYTEERPAILSRLAELERLLSGKNTELERNESEKETLKGDLLRARERELVHIREREEGKQAMEATDAEKVCSCHLLADLDSKLTSNPHKASLVSKLNLSDSLLSARTVQLEQLRVAASLALEQLRIQQSAFSKEREEVRELISSLSSTLPTLRSEIITSIEPILTTVGQSYANAARMEQADAHAQELSEAVRLAKEEARSERDAAIIRAKKEVLAEYESTRSSWTVEQSALNERIDELVREKDDLVVSLDIAETERDGLHALVEKERRTRESVEQLCSERERE